MKTYDLAAKQQEIFDEIGRMRQNVLLKASYIQPSDYNALYELYHEFVNGLNSKIDDIEQDMISHVPSNYIVDISSRVERMSMDAFTEALQHCSTAYEGDEQMLHWPFIDTAMRAKIIVSCACITPIVDITKKYIPTKTYRYLQRGITSIGGVVAGLTIYSLIKKEKTPTAILIKSAILTAITCGAVGIHMFGKNVLTRDIANALVSDAGEYLESIGLDGTVFIVKDGKMYFMPYDEHGVLSQLKFSKEDGPSINHTLSGNFGEYDNYDTDIKTHTPSIEAAIKSEILAVYYTI